MGKHPIIPQRDTRNNARAIGGEEKAASTTGTTAVVVVGGAVARSSAISGAIAHSAAADRDRRYHLSSVVVVVVDDDDSDRFASIDESVAPKRGCAEEKDRPILKITDARSIGRRESGIVGASCNRAHRERRDAGIVGAARPRRNTWHAEHPEDESAVEVAGVAPPSTSRFDAIDSNVERSRVHGATDAPRGRHRNTRIVGDDRTCCAIDVVSYLARRARDRVTRDDPSSIGGRTVERRYRRSGSASSLARGSIDTLADVARAEKVPPSTVDSITIVGTEQGEEGHRRLSISLASATSVSGDNILSNGIVSNAFDYADVSNVSPIIVLESRRWIDGVHGERAGDATAAIDRSSNSDLATVITSPRRSELAARLIAIVDSSCEERTSWLLAETEEAAVDTSSSSSSSSPFSSTLLRRTIARFAAKINPGESTRRTKTDACRRSPTTRVGLILRTLLLGLLAMSLLCDAVLGAPSTTSVLDLEAAIALEDDIEEEELAMPRNSLGDNELEIIRRSIVQGLGLQRIPDPSKANVSQAEYERAHREYLKQVQLSHDELESRKRRSLHVFQTAERPGNRSSLAIDDTWSGRSHRHHLYFPVVIPDKRRDVTVDHASLRFLLQGDHRYPRDLEILVYLRAAASRRLLLRNKISQTDSPKDSRWLELDSTEAVANWLERDSEENHGLELEFLHDGRPTRREISYARLNVFTTTEPDSDRRRKRSTPEELMPLHKGRRSKCKGDNNKKCCRHELTVMFKDLKGFEFIVYPKSFDAGYCKGRCPPRYNPAHHHALLQSLLWKEDRKRVPKPCCAPSKLEQLMIVYFDENDATQLKVSYWKNIQVLECACS